MPYTWEELEKISKEYYSDKLVLQVLDKLKELVMTDVVVGDSKKTQLDDGVTVSWVEDDLKITTPAVSIFLNQEAAQNLLNYLEGKRPKVVWE